MAFTVTPHPAPSPAYPEPRPTHRFRFLRSLRFWIVAGLVTVLALGWTMAFYNYGVSQENAASVAELNSRLDAVTGERDELLAGKTATERSVTARENAVKKREDELKGREDAAKKREDAAKKREDDVKAREDAIGQQEKVQAQNTITEGNWAVGVDIQPGTYRTKEAIVGNCYWVIHSDANGSDIVANDFVTGGRPTVTLKAGQFFTSNRCGDWIKV